MTEARLGIDLGGTAAKLALLWADGRTDTAATEHYATPSPHALLAAVTTALADRLGVAPADVQTVGLSVAGVADDRGVLQVAVNLPALVGVDLRRWLRGALPNAASITIATDTQAAAQAEHRARPVAGRAMYVAIGAGVGAAVLDGGRPLAITRGTPGHLGHIDVSGGEPDAPLAGDGGRGSLEAYIGARALAAAAVDLSDERWLDHPAAQRALAALSRALRIVLPIYRPDEIVLVGGVGLRLGPAIEDIRRRVTDGLTAAAPDAWDLRCGVVGRHAAAIGAAHAAESPPHGAPAAPPDRSHVHTERRNPRSMNLHRLTAAEIVALIQAEDAGLPGAMAAAQPALAAFVEAAEPRFAAGGRLIYLGAGTSGRLGVLDASEMPPTFCTPPDRVIGLIAGGEAALRRSSEAREDDPQGAEGELAALDLTDRDTVLGIAAGGTTPYVLGALAIAKHLAPGCGTGLLACSPIDRPPHADHLIVLPTGPEVITGSTRMKAGTATKLALNTISTTLMVRTGRVYENLMVDVRATNAKLRDRAARIVATLNGLDRAAAFRLLDDAGGEVKTAILMRRFDIDADEARRRLANANGRIGRLLDPETPA